MDETPKRVKTLTPSTWTLFRVMLRRLAQTGLIPEFLMNLPYRSRLMEMTNDLWTTWSVDEQDEFLNELKAKIEAYEDIHDKPDGWVELNKGDDPDEHVYPVSLELLP